MQKVLLNLVTGVFALFVGMTAVQAQTIATYPSEQYSTFGAVAVHHGKVTIFAGEKEWSVKSLTFELQNCSTRGAGVGNPFTNIKLQSDAEIHHGQVWSQDQQQFVTFELVQTYRPNTSRVYLATSDIVANQFGGVRECFRLVLPRSGVVTETKNLSGFFPLRLNAHTLVGAQPFVQFRTNGPTSNRIRTSFDVIGKIDITAGGNLSYLSVHDFYLELRSLTRGLMVPLILQDEATGAVVGERNSSGKIDWINSNRLIVNQAKTLNIVIDSTFVGNTPNESDELHFGILTPCNFTWQDPLLQYNAVNERAFCLQVTPTLQQISYE